MTRVPRLDDRTVDWLCAGPDRAPDWVLATAEAHARRHPRGRVRAWLAGRSLMSHLHLVRAGEEAPPSRVSRTWAFVAAPALTAILVIGAFAVGAGWGRGSIPIAVPTVSPRSSEVPVELSAACRVAGQATENLSARVTRTRGGWLRCETTSDNPGLTGTATLFMSLDRAATGAGDLWGRLTIDAAGATWAGPFSGTVDADGTRHLTGVLLGAGASAGARLMFTATGTEAAFDLEGAIEPSDAPTGLGGIVVRQLTCESGGDPGTESMDPEGVNHVRGRSMTCASEASDPRLAGEVTLVADIEARADDSAGIRGTESLLTADGAWLGTWAGTYDAGWTTHRWTGSVIGSGAEKGLEYRFSTIGEWPRFVQIGVLAGGG